MSVGPVQHDASNSPASASSAEPARGAAPSSPQKSSPPGAQSPLGPPAAVETSAFGRARGPVADRRLWWAFGIAMFSDGLSLFTGPIFPLQWALDVVTAIALARVLGANWRLLPALVAEAIPGLELLPFWILVVLWIGRDGSLPPASARGATPQPRPPAPGQPPTAGR